MTKTIVGIMDNHHSAEKVISELVERGFNPEDIGFAAAEELENLGEAGKSIKPIPLERAAAGATIGGVSGLVIGLVAAAIPGVGPLVAAGPVGTALAGGGIGFTAGGLVGALTKTGVPEDKAHDYAEAVRRGGILVTVSGADELIDQAEAIMKRHGAMDMVERTGHWRAQGWTRFDEQGEPYTAEMRARERESSQLARRGAYQSHFQTAFPGEEYEDYHPAYAFGAELAEAVRFRDRAWPQIENEVKEEWECHHPGGWEKYKEAIRHGWETRAKVLEKA